jgi:CRP/FNR family transcriptional regulator, nitrogen oxide reductase regulator
MIQPADRNDSRDAAMPRTTPLDHDSITPAQCSPDLRRSLLRGVPLFADLDDSQIAEVNRRFRDRGYSAGETIYHSGDPADTFFVLATGAVKLVRHAARGSVLLALLAPGDTFGGLPMLGDETYADTAEAQTACCVLTIAAADLQDILEREPAVARTYLALVSAQLRAARETIRRVSADSVESRVAAALLTLADRVGRPDRGATLITTPLTRQDLADMTGAQVETVSRVMSRLRRDRAIRSGRGWVAVADRARLTAIAAGDDR